MVDEDRCICGEPADDEMAEVFDPKSTADDGDVKVVHVSCIPEGYVTA